MKRIILLTYMLSAGVPSSADKSKAKSSTHIISTRMNVFYFKVDQEFLGADLEVYSPKGIKLLTQKVSHRSVLIDFYYENSGKYSIVIRKGETLRQFNFIKFDQCLETERPKELRVVQGV